MKFGNSLTIIAGSLMMYSTFAHAAVTIDVVESGGDVVASASGSVNTTDLVRNINWSSIGSFVRGSATGADGQIILAPFNSATAVASYTISTSVAFSTGPLIYASSGSGDRVGFLSISGSSPPDLIYLETDYVSNAPIFSTATWSGQSFADLGLITGTYVVTWGAGANADSLTLNIGSVTPPPLACTMYTDRATFEAAAPGLPTEDFEKTSAVAEFDSPLDETTDVPPFIAPGDILPGVVFLNPDAVQRLRLFDSEFASMIPDGISLSDSGNDTDSLVVTLNPAVSAFGFDIFSERDSASVRIYNTNSDLIGSYDGSAPQAGGFLGCISADPVARVVLSAPANSSGNLEALDNVSFGEPSVAPMTYTVGGTVSGLSGTVTLQNNGGDDIIKTTNDGFTFTAQAEGSDYAVTVSSQPSGQTCTVTNGSGTNITANITNVTVTCVTDVVPTYSVGGTVSGLTGSVTLYEDTSAEDLALSTNGSFTFATEQVDGTPYAVTVLAQPTGQTCSVTNSSGTITTADVTNVSVACIDDIIAPPPVPMVPIPTLSQWALILLTMLLGLMVFANRRRLF
jgi:hypothetical protein